eukprot:CAMPEP_0113695902 /NCGR_PEP_ID=MMETSP0038_2-20120614/21172_1 /TAXON_ID=2898 /ORGANISM="Cryptomonas paramecium" /LENGTH=92 /DNA_ID=CAMNT_0000618525 /DNA_START=402 /DNA_END=680 /DNA_ORIENTATION=+ /assembly_acc=CAM_ASM_000170
MRDVLDKKYVEPIRRPTNKEFGLCNDNGYVEPTDGPPTPQGRRAKAFEDQLKNLFQWRHCSTRTTDNWAVADPGVPQDPPDPRSGFTTPLSI